MSRSAESIRIGPVSLATLISVLLLAVLALLCVTSANAAQAKAERQANSTTEAAALDATGQDLVSRVDAELAASNGSWPAVSAKLNTLAHDARDASTLKGSSITTTSGKTGVAFVISASSGKQLEARVSTNDDGTLSIDEWKLTNTQEPTEETLWSGSDNN